MYHKHWLHFFQKDSRSYKIAVKMSDYNIFIENLQKYLKCTGKHYVKVQVSIDTGNRIMQSRELGGK